MLLDYQEKVVLTRVFFAAALGILLGFQRQLRKVAEQKYGVAGMRTHAIVAIGTALVTAIGAISFPQDPLRLAASILTGIGFIGAGTILATSEKIRGLANAATIWVIAAIGIAAGLGYFVSSLATTLIVILILEMKRFEKIE